MIVPLIIAVACVALYFKLHVTFLFPMPRCQSTAKLHGKTAIVTGANTGIGKTTALDLARRGARVILACRNRQRAEAAILDIVKETGNRDVIFMQLDLSSLKSVRSFVEEFIKTESRLDLLINNAGLVCDGRTEEGFGMIFGVNHLGHFLLTVLLLDILKRSGPSRVVNVASKAYKFGKVDFGRLSEKRELGKKDAGYMDLLEKYSDSKLCNVLFTYELNKRLRGTQTTCYCLHPGVIKTEIFRWPGLLWIVLMRCIVFLFALDPVSGAQTTLHCALHPGIEPLSGGYFSQCAHVERMEPKATDSHTAERLWQVSVDFCGLEE